MRLRPRSFGWRFFYVSILVVILSGVLTIAIFLLFVTNILSPSAQSITTGRMDKGLHDLAPQIGAAWKAPNAWCDMFSLFRAERRLKPVRLVVLDVSGRVLYREAANTPLEDLTGRHVAQLGPDQLITLLAGKVHLEKDTVYAVAPIADHGASLGVLLGYLKPYSAYQARPRPISQLLVLLIPCLATIIISSLGSIYLARGLRARLTALAGAIRAMAAGDYQSRLNLVAEDEIGRVAGDFNRMADRLAEARTQEAAMEKLKRELITNVSHDLRGPLTSMQGYLEAMEDGLAGDPVATRKYVGTIRLKCEQLARLVEDLLLYSRLESGNLPLDKRATEAAEWLREGLAKIEPDLALAGLEIIAEIPDSVGIIRLDADRMDQVLANLAQNAVRYAPGGSTVHVALTKGDDGIVISFGNEGPGLDPEDLPHVFERFYRGQNQADGLGAGLGLAISAQIVRAHGGRIWAENMERGVVFRFTLPLETGG